MHPIAFTILGKEIRWYGIMAAVGFMLAVFIMQRIRNHANLKKDQVSDITMIGTVLLRARANVMMSKPSLSGMNISVIIRS